MPEKLAAKAALNMLVQTIALENKDAGLTANLILPGTMDTPVNRTALLMASVQHSAREGIVFRRFLGRLLIAETGLAYFGETKFPILESLRKFLGETFQSLPYSPTQSIEERTRQMSLF